LGILFQMYLLAPLLVRGYEALRARCSLLWVGGFMLCVAVGGHFVGYVVSGSWDIRNLAGYIALFLFGFLAGDMVVSQDRSVARIREWMLRHRVVVFGGIILAFEFLFFVYSRGIFGYSRGIFFVLPFESVLGILGGALVVMLAGNEAARETVLHRARLYRWMRTVGEVSFGLYLWHPVVMRVLLSTKCIGLRDPPYESILVLLLHYVPVVIVSLMVALLSRTVIERPCRALYGRRNPDGDRASSSRPPVE